MRFRMVGAVALAVAVVMSAALRPATAQDAVLAVKSVDEVLGDLRYLVEAVAPEEAARQIGPIFDQFAGPEALAGLDRTRPLGVMVTLGKTLNEPPTIFGAVPIKDLDALMNTLGQFGLAVGPARNLDGFSHEITLPDGNTRLYVVATEDYAFVTPIPADAAKLKATKVADWYPSRPGVGDISLALRIERLPQEMKDQFLEQLKQSNDASRERLEEESDAEYRGRMAGLDLSQEAVTRLVRDGGTLALDLTVDKKSEQVSLEASLTGRTGTPLADDLASFARQTSRFAGLAPDAPFAAWISLPIPEEFAEVLAESIDQGRAESIEKADSPAEKEMIEAVAAAFKPTIAAGKLDLGLAIDGPAKGGDSEQATYTMLGGMTMANGQQLLEALRKVIEQEKPGDAEFEFDAAKAADGTPLHRVKGPLDEQGRRIFGDAEMYLAVRDDSVVFGFGEESRKATEDALASSAKPAAPASGMAGAPVALTVRVARLAGLMDEQREAARQAADEVFKGQADPRDRVALSLRGEGGALRLRLSVDVPAFAFFARVGGIEQAGKVTP